MTIPTVRESEVAERENDSQERACGVVTFAMGNSTPQSRRSLAYSAGPSFLGSTESNTELLSVRWSLM
jgi:hypothetical protein